MIIGCIMKEETDGEEPAETAWTRLGAEDLPSVGEGGHCKNPQKFL